MRITLTIDLDSHDEDQIGQLARMLTAASGGGVSLPCVIRETGVVAEPDKEQPEKPKRGRRTKAEMEAAAVQDAPSPATTVEETAPFDTPAEPLPVETPTAPPAATPVGKSGVSVDTIRERIIALTKATNPKVSIGIVTEVGGAAKVSQVPEENYPALLAALDKAIAEAEAAALVD